MDQGNTAFLLISAALVLLMTPGLAFFYGGLVKAKSVISMMMLSFGALGLIGVLWVLYGYAIAFPGAEGLVPPWSIDWSAIGLTSLLETHDDFSRSPSILDLYARGMSGKVEVLWDTLHSYRHGERADETWAALGPRMRLVHVKDATVATPETFDFALTGGGRVPVRGFIDLLGAKGYDGFVNFEWEKGWHPEIAEPEIALPHFMQWVRGG